MLRSGRSLPLNLQYCGVALRCTTSGNVVTLIMAAWAIKDEEGRQGEIMERDCDVTT